MSADLEKEKGLHHDDGKETGYVPYSSPPGKGDSKGALHEKDSMRACRLFKVIFQKEVEKKKKRTLTVYG